MADELWEDIASALSTIVDTTDKSGNMKKELKNTIAETVSTLRNLLAKLKDISESKTKAISDLETAVTKMRAQYEEGREKCNKWHASPSVVPRQETGGSRTQGYTAPSMNFNQEPVGSRAQEVVPSSDRRELYSSVLRSKPQRQQFKVTVKSKDKLSAEAIKGILKSKINPTDIKVGINSLKALTDGRVLITTTKKEEAEALEMDIKSKCGEELEVILHKRRNPRLVIRSIPEDITTSNIEETLITQNPDFALETGDIAAKYCYETKKHSKNLVVEVSAQTRKLLLHKKIKLGWTICKVEDYLVATRCFKCSRFNHRHQDCKGVETCPLCAGHHKMKECTANSSQFKCINCASFNLHNKNAIICDNHSTLDRNCPSLQVVLDRYRQNINY
jgi:hypothetical protein